MKLSTWLRNLFRRTPAPEVPATPEDQTQMSTNTTTEDAGSYLQEQSEAQARLAALQARVAAITKRSEVE